MAIQELVDLASTININKRKLTGVQFARNQTPKTDLSPTKQPFRFTLTIPAQPWYLMRSIMEQIDYLDRYQSEVIYFGNNSCTEFIFRYQGDVSIFISNPIVNSFVGNQMIIGNLPVLPLGQFLFKSGDMLQISPYPYPFMVVNDVVSNGVSTTYTITTHRPNILSYGVAGNDVIVGSSCQFKVFMPELPTYTLRPGGYIRSAAGSTINNALVEFDGPIVLYEALGDS